MRSEGLRWTTLRKLLMKFSQSVVVGAAWLCGVALGMCEGDGWLSLGIDGD